MSKMRVLLMERGGAFDTPFLRLNESRFLHYTLENCNHQWFQYSLKPRIDLENFFKFLKIDFLQKILLFKNDNLKFLHQEREK